MHLRIFRPVDLLAQLVVALSYNVARCLSGSPNLTKRCFVLVIRIVEAIYVVLTETSLCVHVYKV